MSSLLKSKMSSFDLVVIFLVAVLVILFFIVLLVWLFNATLVRENSHLAEILKDDNMTKALKSAVVGVDVKAGTGAPDVVKADVKAVADAKAVTSDISSAPKMVDEDVTLVHDEKIVEAEDNNPFKCPEAGCGCGGRKHHFEARAHALAADETTLQAADEVTVLA
jgi:hypothetical protein